MKQSRTKKNRLGKILSLLLLAASLVCFLTATADAQVGTLRILVIGRELPSDVRAEQRGAKVFIPLAPVARQLGYTVNFDFPAETVSVRRAGAVAEFLRQTGEIREGGVTVTQIADTFDIVFSANPETLSLPIEVISPLLNAAVSVDTDKQAVLIDSRDIVNSTSSAERRRLDIGTLEYNYSGAISGQNYSQGFFINSTGRIGNNLYEMSANFNGNIGSSYGRFANFSGGNFTLRRDEGDIIQVGDLRTTFVSQTRFQNVLTRGLSYERPVLSKKAWLGFYGGRSFSGAIEPLDLRDLNERDNYSSGLKFDSNIFGTRFTYEPLGNYAANKISSRRLILSTGAAVMSGKYFKGQSVDVAVQYSADKFTVEAEVGAGNYNVKNFRGREASGFGTGYTVSGSYTPWKFISMQGRYEKYSPKFFGLQATGFYNNREVLSAGFSSRPFKRFSIGASAGIYKNGNSFVSDTIDQTPYRARTYGISGGYDPKFKFLPRVTATYTINADPVVGRFSLLFVNLSREFKSVRPFVNYTSSSFRNNTSHTLSMGTAYTNDRLGQFQVQETFGFNKAAVVRQRVECLQNITLCPTNSARRLQIGNHSGSIDWNPQNLFEKFQFSVGGGYIAYQNEVKLQLRSSVTMRLPRNQSLQVFYYNSGFGNELRFTMAGPLNFWQSKSALDSKIENENILINSTVSGRLFIDANYNRQYDPETDKLVGDVRVSLDNGRTVTVSENGIYYFDNVAPGEHQLTVNAQDIRANLVPSNGLIQDLTVLPRTNVNTVFRLVESGTLSGRVWHDRNTNGVFDEGEGLADIHLLASSGRDTYTDTDGVFLFSDLPPGSQTVTIDERYKPENLSIAVTSQRADVKSGAETGNVAFIFKTKPREVREVLFNNQPKDALTGKDEDK